MSLAQSLERIRKAVAADLKSFADLPEDVRAVSGLTRVVLGDVGRIIEAIPEAARNAADWINDLHVGVKNNAKDQVAYQTTDHLAELLEVFDATRPAEPVKAESPKSEEPPAEPVKAESDGAVE